MNRKSRYVDSRRDRQTEAERETVSGSLSFDEAFRENPSLPVQRLLFQTDRPVESFNRVYQKSFTI